MSHSHDSHDSHGHVSHDDPKVIRKHLKIYWGVFMALMVGSLLTVAVAYIPHMPIYLAITVAVLIASTKASLVAGFFMHLIGEVKAIWWSLALTAIFFVFLMALPILTENDNLGEYSGTPPVTIAELDAAHAAEHGADHGDEAHDDAHEEESH